MKKCFIFAHYDRNNELKQYIIDEINLLNTIGDILFISDCEYVSNIEKLPKLKYLQISRHNLYDAHSYKCGFEFLRDSEQLDGYDNITFVNSSILFPNCDRKIFLDSLNEMDCSDEKVYGMCKSGFLLQSYWITCKNNVYKIINTFFNNYIPAETSHVLNWWEKNKQTNERINKYLRWYGQREKEVGEELAKKWIYTVINFEEGISRFLCSNKIKLVALDYGTWKDSRFITKVPREKLLEKEIF